MSQQNNNHLQNLAFHQLQHPTSGKHSVYCYIKMTQKFRKVSTTLI